MFDWGKPYLLTDLKEGVFVNEPAVCVGKHDSDMKRPTMCAVCGEPLRSQHYYSFCLMGPNGHHGDVMIGGGCIRERIRVKELNVEKGPSPKATLERVVIDFPHSGRWYGTFLHHCIAKPYVRNKANAEKWDKSVLNLPGVRYIMRVIDDLRDKGWKLDAEMRLDSGNVDLLATHPEHGTIVFDWKSDLCFDNKEAYIRQINRYMAELYSLGLKRIMGYIIWVREEWKERVPFTDKPDEIGELKPLTYVPSPNIRCTLNIDLDDGEGIKKRKITEYSHHYRYGDEVFFFIPPCEPWKPGYKFVSFEASPYREGERPQCFNGNDLEDGIPLRFICSKKRHTFTIKAEWKRIRPFDCKLGLCRGSKDTYRMAHVLFSKSKIDENNDDYVEFKVSDINRCLNNTYITHAKLLIDGNFDGIKSEWDEGELSDGMSIRIPCVNGCDKFQILIETKVRKKENKDPHPAPKSKTASPPSGSWEEFYERRKENPLPPESHSEPEIPSMHEPDPIIPLPNPTMNTPPHNRAEFRFTPGRVYKSGGRYYGIYKRKASERANTAGMIDVAEVSPAGDKLSNLTWRHVYLTLGGKEFIYGISDVKWKVYTKEVLADISPKDVDKYGNIE